MGARAADCPTKSIPVHGPAGTATTARCGVTDTASPAGVEPSRPAGISLASGAVEASRRLARTRALRGQSVSRSHPGRSCPSRERVGSPSPWPSGPEPLLPVVVPWSMIEISREEFEEAVNDALDSLPDQIAEAIAHANVVILIEEEPDPQTHGMELLGLYEGIPLDKRSVFQGFAEPDRILIFRGPLQRLARDRQHLVDQIAVTVLHEEIGRAHV